MLKSIIVSGIGILGLYVGILYVTKNPYFSAVGFWFFSLMFIETLRGALKGEK